MQYSICGNFREDGMWNVLAGGLDGFMLCCQFDDAVNSCFIFPAQPLGNLIHLRGSALTGAESRTRDPRFAMRRGN